MRPRNGDINNHIAEHHLQTGKPQNRLCPAKRVTYSTGGNLEQTALNRYNNYLHLTNDSSKGRPDRENGGF